MKLEFYWNIYCYFLIDYEKNPNIFKETCSTEFEQIARQLEFELQPRIFVLLPRYYI